MHAFGKSTESEHTWSIVASMPLPVAPANASKFQPVATNVSPVRVSDSGRRKIIVFNVVGLLCNIRPLHDMREWGLDLVVHHVRTFNVNKKQPTVWESNLAP